MNNRTHFLNIIILNNEVLFVSKKFVEIVEFMEKLEVVFVARQTLSAKLNADGYFCFVAGRGVAYHFYRWENPYYKPQPKAIIGK